MPDTSRRAFRIRTPGVSDLQRWIIGMLVTGGALIGTYQAYAITSVTERVRALETHASQQDRDRGDILREVQRVEDTLQTISRDVRSVGDAVHRIGTRVHSR